MRTLPALVALVGLTLPRLGLACACCSDPGTRNVGGTPYLPLEKAIEEVGTTAFITASAAEPELLVAILGSGGAAELAVSTKIDPSSVVITLKNGKRFGTLVFKPSGTGTSRAVDIDPFDAKPDGNVTIHHEAEYPLVFRGTGLLAGKTGTALLVLTGTSNACPPEHYEVWHLTLDTKGDERVQLYGHTKPQP